MPSSKKTTSWASSSKAGDITEFDILKASHKFLRDDDETNLSWEDKLAKKYYNSLFREFAVCNLKHYKTGQFSIRWRTEAEVLSGAGEETCGNTRCTFHEASRSLPMPPLRTVELPFAYEEQGEAKSALVKVVLCDKCLKKLMWKREKAQGSRAGDEELQQSNELEEDDEIEDMLGSTQADSEKRKRVDGRRSKHGSTAAGRIRQRSSRSRSPTRKHNRHRQERSPIRRHDHSTNT